MENVVYNELRARGHSVDAGVVERRIREESGDVRKQLEVDGTAAPSSLAEMYRTRSVLRTF